MDIQFDFVWRIRINNGNSRKYGVCTPMYTEEETLRTSRAECIQEVRQRK